MRRLLSENYYDLKINSIHYREFMKKLILLGLLTFLISPETNAQSIKEVTPRGFVNPITYENGSEQSSSLRNYI